MLTAEVEAEISGKAFTNNTGTKEGTVSKNEKVEESKEEVDKINAPK